MGTDWSGPQGGAPIPPGGLGTDWAEGLSGNLATLTTLSVHVTSGTTASSGGNITDDGGSGITERGVCWSSSPNPTIADSKTSDGTGTGVFTSAITGLTPGASYYVRAFATNSASVAYGNQRFFKALMGFGAGAARNYRLNMMLGANL